MKRFLLDHMGEIVGTVCTYALMRIVWTFDHLPRVMRWE